MELGKLKVQLQFHILKIIFYNLFMKLSSEFLDIFFNVFLGSI